MHPVGCKDEYVRVRVARPRCNHRFRNEASRVLTGGGPAVLEWTGWLVTSRMKRIEDFWKLRGSFA